MEPSTGRQHSYVAATGRNLVEEITVGDALRQAAQAAPDIAALVERVDARQRIRQWTYAELLIEAERVARAMLDHVDPGEKVAIWANNVPEWVLVQMGAALAGVILVTVNPALRLEETRHVLRHSEAAMVFHLDTYRGFGMTACLRTIEPHLPALRQSIVLSDWEDFCSHGVSSTALPSVHPEDIVQIQYTSGTTGRPKGARLRHRGVVNAAKLAMCQNFELDAGDSVVSPMPLFHTAGSGLHVLGCVQACATHVLMPNFDPSLQLALIEAERSCFFGGVATMLRAMLDHPAFVTTNLSSVRLAISGGAMVESALASEVESKVGVPLAIVYGLTECSGVISLTRSNDDPYDRKMTVGRAPPGIELQVVDPVERSSVISVGEVGELCTRGFHVMAGYHHEPEKTAQAIDDQGWLHTGDLASIDGRGYVKIEGRLNDMIIRGGENIYPTEIEGVLLMHTAVAEAAVIGVPDMFWGERVVAFVRLTSGMSSTPLELQSFLARHIAAHKIPKEWHFTDKLPINAAGKVLKTELRWRAAKDPEAR